MTTSGDPSLPGDETPRLGAFHNATIDPSRQHQGSLTAGAHEYDRGPMPWPERDRINLRFANRQPPIYERSMVDDLRQRTAKREPLEPRYTAKLNRTSPHFPTIGEAKQRRRDFWSKVIARGGITMMAAAPLGAWAWGTGVFPAGAFVGGLIVFGACCFVNGCRRRS